MFSTANSTSYLLKFGGKKNIHQLRHDVTLSDLSLPNVLLISGVSVLPSVSSVKGCE